MVTRTSADAVAVWQRGGGAESFVAHLSVRERGAALLLDAAARVPAAAHAALLPGLGVALAHRDPSRLAVYAARTMK